MRSSFFFCYTEYLLQIRRAKQWLYPTCFFLLVLSLFPLAISPEAKMLAQVFPGCVWITALLASLLSIENIFASEMEDGHLEQMITGNCRLTNVVIAKLIVQWTTTQLPLTLLIPILGILFHVSLQTSFVLLLTLLIGTPLLTNLGALAVLLTLGLRQQGVLLGLLLLPLTTPILIFGVVIVQQYVAGFNITGPVAFFAGSALLANLLLPFVITQILKVSVDI